MSKSENLNKLESNFLSDLELFVMSELSGNFEGSDEIKLNNLPSKEYIIGSLCPEDINVLNERKTSIRVSNLGVSFITKQLGAELEISNEFKVFDLISNSDEFPKFKFKRVNVSIPKFKIKLEEGIQNFNLSEIVPDLDINSRLLENLKFQIKIEINKNFQEEGMNLVTIYFINKSPKYHPKDFKFETTIFDVEFKINFLNLNLENFNFEYKTESGMKKNKLLIRSHNCSFEYNDINKELTTKHFKKAELKKIVPNIDLISIDGDDNLSFKFDDLSSSKKFNIFDNLLSILNNYSTYYESTINKEEEHKKEEYGNNSVKFNEMLKRLNFSIELIKSDSLVEKAFDLMQESFEETNKGDFDGWRLFQIIFIILNIKDIVKKENFDITELLHVDTGGGKSEAYFGLVIFTIFYDRLTGKEYGVSAITKFPLRMLSIQQLQRISKIFIWAEEIRLNNKLGGDPFSIGYFVGNSKEFPDHNEDLYHDLSKTTNTIGRIIDCCPLCNGRVNLTRNEVDITVVHSCTSCNKIFYLYFSDEEIYRKLPTFLISTVDKISSISYNHKFRTLIGSKLNKCKSGHGFFPRGGECRIFKDKRNCGCTGLELNTEFDSGPILMIQDEMHLVRESFGTIDSHFETLIESLKKKFTNFGIKNICMTATVSGADYQIKQLYNKKERTFPSISPCGKGVKDPFFTKTDETHRIYLGLRPNVRENRYAIRKSFRLILDFITKIEEDKKLFAKKYFVEEVDIDGILTNYKSYLSYHNKKDDIKNLIYYQNYEIDESEEKKKYLNLKTIELTGDSSLDNIRKTIQEIQTKNTLDAREVDIVYATNIVSHGVDIEKWNIMTFQGFPRSTAEYIQAGSRVGRKHIGLVLIWFYPNRIKDLSIFENFEEYHEHIEDHVEKVPILRWANLGFQQTFNSLFCAILLNFYSEKLNKPFYTVEQVNEYFNDADDKCRDDKFNELKKLIIDSYGITEGSNDSRNFENKIYKEIEGRLKSLFNYGGPNKFYFPKALSDCGKEFYANQRGMRGIQNSFIMSSNRQQKTFIDIYKGGKK